MKDIKEFVVDRAVWLRGEGSENSRLLRRQDDKMCCLGIYLDACGIAAEKLEDQATPEDVDPSEDIPAWLYRLTKDSKECTAKVWNLIDTNDDEDIPETEREAEVERLFANEGIKVTFTGVEDNVKLELDEDEMAD